MAAPHVTRTDDETLAAIAAGHEMAGMAMSADGEAAARRIRRSSSPVTLPLSCCSGWGDDPMSGRL